jgi:hypothetical protein
MRSFLKPATGCLLGVAGALCLGGCKPRPQVSPPPPLVEVAPVTRADVPIYHEWIGMLDGLVNKTELDVKRYGPLVKDKAISQEEYDDAVQDEMNHNQRN